MEYLLLIKEFFQTRKTSEKIGIIIPLIIGGIVFYFSDTCSFYKNGTNIQTSILTVIGILLGFTISIFSIFISGNMESIQEAKKHPSNFKLYGKKISLHTTIIISLGYVILIEGILLIINVISPIFFEVYSFTGRILFSVSIFLLLHSITTLLKAVLNFYFIVTKYR
jgi:predicted ferric reductase